MDKDILKRIIIEHQERIPELKINARDIVVDPAANYIFTGQRRAGKTYFMYQIIQQKLKAGYNAKNVLYINFEDERLMEMNVQGLDQIMECYAELFQSKPLIFFDEIQIIPAWQKFVRRLADNKYQVCVTGSNASMLSSEMASTLGGRFLVKEISTLSFKEFLNFQHFKAGKNAFLSSQRFEIIRLFNEYFSFGGFPETINFENKKEYLSNIFQKVFLGDIIARYQVRNPYALRLLLKKLAESTMDETSFTRIKNIIQSTGIQAGTATLIEYVSYLEETFLLRGISNFKAKISERETKKKYYYRDHGLLNLFLWRGESALLETIVFNKLYSQHAGEVFYFRDATEVDFYVPGELLAQASYSISNPETRQREIAALSKAMQALKPKNVLIITYNDREENIQTDYGNIRVLPVWRWLMQE